MSVPDETRESPAQSEERLALALDAVGGGVFDWRLETNERIRSDSWYRLTGFERGELERWEAEHGSIVHPDDKVVMERMFKAHVRGERDRYHLEFRIRHKSGEWRWLLGRGIIVERAPDGSPVRIVGTDTDITDSKRAQEALEQSERRFRTMFESAAIAMALDDEDGRLLETNPAFQQMLGYTAKELQGKSFLDLTHPDDVDLGRKLFQQLVAGERDGFHEEQRYLRQDGTLLWGLVAVSAIRDSQGRFRHAVAMVEDITERKEARRALEESESRFRAIFDSTPECVKLVGADGTLQEMNPAGLAMVGADSRDQVRGVSIYDLIAPAYHRAYRNLNKRVFSGRRATLEFEIIGLEGTRRRMETHAVPLRDSSGAVKSQLAVTRDVTERKRLEDRLRQSQKMEAIGQLAGGVAHDFNNILTIVFAHVELMRDAIQSASGDARDLLPNLEQIEQSCARAAALTRQLVTFGRRQMIKPTVLDLNRILADMKKMLSRLIRENIDLKLVCEPRLWSIHADAGQIEQVVMNLVINAGDAMPNGGKLTVESSNVTLEEARTPEHAEPRSGRHVMIAVSDNGCGIDERVRGRIFEPFFTTKGVGEGTGLGLATVHGIVQQAGGHVTVYSEPGHGSTFKVYIPARTEAAEIVSQPARERVADRGSETVIVCEDDEALRELNSRALREQGYHVLPAENAAKALEAADVHPGRIHLLVTDVIMPGLNGRQLAEVLREMRPDIKVLYVSGYTANVIAPHGVLEPGVEFLGKPFNSTELLLHVRNVLDRESESVDGR